jgi:meso-butanediol dehydrogenase / (S,S)-butanediol dehydrogenase / diacetyl reductase
MFDFTGKRVLVTGGARGIGAATAIAFCAQGARVAIGTRRSAAFDSFLARASSDARIRTDDIVPAIGDVRGQAGAHSVVAAAIDRLEGLDVLVNSAGVFAEVAIADVTEEHWDDTIATNLGATFFCSQAALPALEASAGNIVNVASDAGLIGYASGAAYSASKGGVVNLTRAMAVELARRVRVNCVCPGNVETEMLFEAALASGNPTQYLAGARNRAHLKRMATPAEVAAAILYLASREASFTTGVSLPVDGGGTAGF